VALETGQVRRCVVFLNAIHLMPDKAGVLKRSGGFEAGGLLAFNSTFFNGAYVEGTSGFWRRWIVRSVQALRRGHRDQAPGHAAAMEWFSADQYRDALREPVFVPPPSSCCVSI